MKTALCLLLLSAVAAGPTKTFFTQQQALKNAFGEKVETSKKTHYWSKEQRVRLADLASVNKANQVSAYHSAFSTKPTKGQKANSNTVWFDKRIVRTKGQEIMLVINDKGVIQDLVVCAFDEPIKYKPSAKWYAQFKGKKLNDKLQLKQEIHGVSGATLTARSTTEAARELLAAAQVAREAAKVKKPK
ncbi:MAG: FMN-binding protein [Planctomycetes bacterium]|nr:FMN-binding protein [Planctomycetota bacterium]MCP4770953.1 FMN-binding protein [Planctomycetota bacterium]MCP4861673.1 FMN-binding protein [Planctomycetota bacterium]